MKVIGKLYDFIFTSFYKTSYVVSGHKYSPDQTAQYSTSMWLTLNLLAIMWFVASNLGYTLPKLKEGYTALVLGVGAFAFHFVLSYFALTRNGRKKRLLERIDSISRESSRKYVVFAVLAVLQACAMIALSGISSRWLKG